MNNQTTTAHYKDAIRALRRYIANETDEENVEEASAKIREYRFKIIDNEFDAIVNRTKRLTTLMHDLQAILANASDTPALSGVIGDITNIVTDVSSIVNPQS